MGMKALDSHAKSRNTQSMSEEKNKLLPSPAGSHQLTKKADASQLAASAPAAPSAMIDLRTSFGSTPTLKAEVLWTLHTIAKHQSYNGNEGISELFKYMFPGSDKKAYTAKFGLAIHIKDELVSKVNKSPFVLMFDESLNETTKTKQLDVHVRFWDQAQVQSRYLGYQFMGHSSARDLLSHLKVSLINFYYQFMY